MYKILKPISSHGTDGSVVGIAKGKSVIIALLDEYGVMREERAAAVYLEALTERPHRAHGGR